MSYARQGSGVADLIVTIDAYLAEQSLHNHRRRRESCGTMFVDLDEDGEMKISWRHKPNLSTIDMGPRSPFIAATNDGMEVRFNHARRRLYIEGQDAHTGYAYDYDGTIMHVHHDPGRPSSGISEYWSIDAAEYNPELPLMVVDEELPSVSHERRKRAKVVGFISALARKINMLGLMGLLNQKRKDRRHSLHSPPIEAPWARLGNIT